jgi:hypothetical protein
MRKHRHETSRQWKDHVNKAQVKHKNVDLHSDNGLSDLFSRKLSPDPQMHRPISVKVEKPKFVKSSPPIFNPNYLSNFPCMMEIDYGVPIDSWVVTEEKKQSTVKTRKTFEKTRPVELPPGSLGQAIGRAADLCTMGIINEESVEPFEQSFKEQWNLPPQFTLSAYQRPVHKKAEHPEYTYKREHIFSLPGDRWKLKSVTVALNDIDRVTQGKEADKARIHALGHLIGLLHVSLLPEVWLNWHPYPEGIQLYFYTVKEAFAPRVKTSFMPVQRYTVPKVDQRATQHFRLPQAFAQKTLFERTSGQVQILLDPKEMMLQRALIELQDPLPPVLHQKRPMELLLTTKMRDEWDYSSVQRPQLRILNAQQILHRVFLSGMGTDAALTLVAEQVFRLLKEDRPIQAVALVQHKMPQTYLEAAHTLATFKFGDGVVGWKWLLRGILDKWPKDISLTHSASKSVVGQVLNLFSVARNLASLLQNVYRVYAGYATHMLERDVPTAAPLITHTDALRAIERYANRVIKFWQSHYAGNAIVYGGHIWKKPAKAQKAKLVRWQFLSRASSTIRLIVTQEAAVKWEIDRRALDTIVEDSVFKYRKKRKRGKMRNRTATEGVIAWADSLLLGDAPWTYTALAIELETLAASMVNDVKAVVEHLLALYEPAPDEEEAAILDATENLTAPPEIEPDEPTTTATLTAEPSVYEAEEEVAEVKVEEPVPESLPEPVIVEDVPPVEVEDVDFAALMAGEDDDMGMSNLINAADHLADMGYGRAAVLEAVVALTGNTEGVCDPALLEEIMSLVATRSTAEPVGMLPLE